LDRNSNFNCNYFGLMKIGLLGGSFNPPHQGHLHISLEAKKRLNLDQVWWLPTKQNPLKKEKNCAFDERVKLCDKLIDKTPKILVKSYEKKLNTVYTIDLLKRIIKKYPSHKFFLIMGADSIINFHLWKNWKEIIQLMPLLIFDRDNDFNLAKKSRAWLYNLKINGKKSHFFKIKKVNISSTKIRENNV